MNLKGFFFNLVLQNVAFVNGKLMKQEDTTCTKNGIYLPKNYDTNEVPSKPINIDVTISIVQINEIDDVHATVNFIAWLTFEWEDIRVKSKNGTKSEERGYLKGLQLDKAQKEKLWTPDTYYYKLKDLDRGPSDSGSSGNIFIIADYSVRL